jgi:curved DNA-binding protein CbpA
MEYKHFYKVLEIERSAPDDTIKRAYRKQVRKHHPDGHMGLQEHAVRVTGPVEEGMLEPVGPDRAEWLFKSTSITLVRRVWHLKAAQ